jgi:hypothetical protein
MMKNTRNWIGGLLTAVYLFSLGWYTYIKWEKITELAPNELGDMLAGAFGPLAFAWLVLGYIQQGAELQQNTLALNLQAEELKNSVEQQTRIAQATQLQLQNELDRLKHEREVEERSNEAREKEKIKRFNIMQPDLHPFYSFGGQSGNVVTGLVKLNNSGASYAVTNVHCSDDWINLSKIPLTLIPQGSIYQFSFTYRNSTDISESAVITLTYKDHEQNTSHWKFRIIKISNNTNNEQIKVESLGRQKAEAPSSV